ncbi:MAG: ABC transporter ATP-binding protein [Candidatus Thermoplasmatota archaeon]|nr:ABC transporter ATP-binding protein [Candidatus Thermoplasmatota archaeon]MCL6014459.1 ABC transporter ATP-binding protein [Candidatus Thermoplasmatota archaeon]
MNTKSVKVSNLTKKYGNFKAVDNISFDLEGDGAIAYLGQNGAGKTTTFKMMTGLINPTEGKVLIEGIDVTKNRTKALMKIGALIETPEPYAALTVEEAVRLAGELKGIKKREVIDHLETFGSRVKIPGLDRKVGTLSRGQRARVVFVAAFLGNPDIIFLDEPTNGMDPAERKIIRDVILEWKKEHMILMSSHLLQEVTDTCENVLFINNGKLLLQDSTRNIESRFNSKSLKVDFLNSVNMNNLKEALDGFASSVEPQTEKSAIIYFDGELSNRVKILKAVQTVGDVITFSEYGSSLEEAFVNLIDEKSQTK